MVKSIDIARLTYRSCPAKERHIWRSYRSRAKVHIISAVITAISCLFGFLPVNAQINADQVMNIGRNAMYFEDYVVAIQYFNQAIATKPYMAKPYFYRSIAKLNLEDFKGAEEDASKAIELNEFITDAWEVRGVARQNLGDNAGAIADYEHALSLIPRNRQLLFNLAVARTKEKDYAKADSTFNEIIEYYPGFENAYLGRAQMYLETSDTLKALADIDTALVRNPNSFNGHVMRAELLMRRSRPLFRNALANMDKAIKLEPKQAGLYVNRAYIRYNLNDWDGAMADYDYALSLEPLNKTALFNRGLLNTEVNANDRALEDFTAVINLDPSDHRAHYNRAQIRARKHDFAGAIEDINAVIDIFPNFPTGYLVRSEFERSRGNLTKAAADYDKAMTLTRKLHPVDGKVDHGNPELDRELNAEELTEREFASLLTVDDNSDLRQEYNNTAIRGRVQDRNINIEPEPMIELAYYSSPNELNSNTYYIKEVDNLNTTRQLRFVVFATINPPQLFDEDAINSHFRSIEYYNSYIATHTPRAIDFIGRAMDFITLRDYASAIRDLDRAIALNPDFAPAYMMRAQSRFRLHNAGSAVSGEPASLSASVKVDGLTRQGLDRKEMDEIIKDLDEAIRLVPTNPAVHYNKGVALIAFNDIDGALQSLNRAIELKPDFGQAYYNRGFVLLKNGQRAAGIEDLSRAGELGVVSAYNLIKRISR